MEIWQLQEAKARLSELIRLCLKKGPQILSVRGTETAVIISKEEYEKLKGKKASFVEFMNASPLKGVKIDTERGKSSMRDLEL